MRLRMARRGLRLAGTVNMCVVCLALAAAHGGLAPENVAMVVNADSWASKAVANEFVALHHVPPGNVVYLSNLDSYERASADTFRNGIVKPVLTVLTQRGLAAQIDCLVYAPDLPMAVDIRGDFPEGNPPESVGPFASITGLTYLYEAAFSGETEYTGLDANRYYRAIELPIEQPTLTAKQMTTFAEAMGLMQHWEWARACTFLAALAEEQPGSALIHFRHAECRAAAGEADAALAALAKSVDRGFHNARAVQHSPHLVPLRERAEFKELLAKMEAVVVKPALVAAFRHAYAWTPSGKRAADGKGDRYLLSTMLAVTSGRGNSVDEAITCLRRSAKADAASPEGTFYFARNEDDRSTVRDGLYPSAVSALHAMGMQAEIVEGELPTNRPDVLGATLGTASFDWPGSDSVILPGAICDNFTRYGGVLAEKGEETPLTDFLRFGAAGACGTVAEPLAVPQKFPSPFLHAYYAAGCCLAEAFYQAVAAPYQLLVVGDPLCAPWAERPTLSLEGLEPGAEIKGRFEMRPVITGLGEREAAYYELYIDGARRAIFPSGQTPAADSSQLADGFHEIALVAVLDDAVETRGWVRVPVRVNNKGRSVTVRETKRAAVAWDEPLVVRASAPGAKGILLLHNRRILGTIPGEAGMAELDLRAVGQGLAGIRTIAVMDENRTDTIFGPTIELEVVPPPLSPAIAAMDTEALAPGLILTMEEGEPPVTIAETWAGDWLGKSGAAGKAFSLEGLFEVPADGVYQFQVRGNFSPELSVDGETVGRPEPGYWRFYPVALAKGMHRVRVLGVAPADHPDLKIRFGGKGTHSLGKDRFFHTVEVKP